MADIFKVPAAKYVLCDSAILGDAKNTTSFTYTHTFLEPDVIVIPTMWKNATVFQKLRLNKFSDSIVLMNLEKVNNYVPTDGYCRKDIISNGVILDMYDGGVLMIRSGHSMAITSKTSNIGMYIELTWREIVSYN